jgi:hypothetical protein
MTDRSTWPSVPVVLADALYTEFGYGSTRLPSPMVLPAVQVIRIGGYNDRITDYARVNIVVATATEDDAEHLSEQIRSWLIDTRPIKGAGRLLDGATTEVAPHWIPFADEQFTEYVATYVITSRRA